MSNKLIKTLLAEKWTDPDSGKIPGIAIREIIIKAGIAEQAGELLSTLKLGKTLALVSDPNTHSALGKNIEKILKKSFNLIRINLDDGVKPLTKTAENIKKESSDADAIIAIGSGTINDLCKYASYKAKKPYVVFGTALSMNGYASANASIIDDVARHSFKTHLPAAIYIDLDIAAAAPERLIKSGFGDSICRSTAESDWFLANKLTGSNFKKAPFDLLEESEKILLKNAGKLLEKDIATIENLAETLILSGLGMYISGGSYPASQGEHMIAHYMEMAHGDKTPKSLHGEQIAVTTLTMARLQEMTLKSIPEIRADISDEEEITRHLGPKMAKFCENSIKRKMIDYKSAMEMNSIIEEKWSEIRDNIKSCMISSQGLESALKKAGCPTRPEDIGWPKALYAGAVRHALFTRNRFTFLDLAHHSGVMEEFLENI